DADGRLIVAREQVVLPYAASVAGRRADQQLVCEFALKLDADAGDDTAIYIPSFADSVSIMANGEHVLMAENFHMRTLRFATVPAFAALPAAAMNTGENIFRLTLSARHAHS